MAWSMGSRLREMGAMRTEWSRPLASGEDGVLLLSGPREEAPGTRGRTPIALSLSRRSIGMEGESGVLRALPIGRIIAQMTEWGQKFAPRIALRRLRRVAYVTSST